jgi:hypothetical protein
VRSIPHRSGWPGSDKDLSRQGFLCPSRSHQDRSRSGRDNTLLARNGWRNAARRSGSLLVTDRSLGSLNSLFLSRAPPERAGGGLRAVTSTRQRATAGAARRRGELHRADGDRRVGRAIDARRGLATRGVGRAWIKQPRGRRRRSSLLPPLGITRLSKSRTLRVVRLSRSGERTGRHRS